MTHPLEYVGPVIDQNTHVSYRSYVTSKMANNLTVSQIDTAITNALNSYSTKSYVDSRDALNATQSYIQAQDNLRVRLSQKDVANGVPALNSVGRMDPARISAPSTQRWPRAFWSPASYPGTPTILSSSTETQVYTCAITNPGYNYKVLVFGSIDGLTSVDGLYPIVSVRVGAGVTGPVVAQGRGIKDSYNYLSIDNFDRVTSGNLGGAQYWEEDTISGSGGVAECNGSSFVWSKSGTNLHSMLYKRLGSDATTDDDYQEISWSCTNPGERTTGPLGTPHYNQVCGRMSADKQSYVGFRMVGPQSLGDNNWLVQCVYAVGGVEDTLGSSVSLIQNSDDVFTSRQGTSSGKRYFQFLRNGTSFLTVQDTGNVTAMGNSNLNWGFKVRAGLKETLGVPVDQCRPASMNWITMNDLAPGVDGSSYGPINLHPVGLQSQSVLSGAQTLTVTVNRSSSLGTVGIYPVDPSLYVVAVPA